MKQHFNILTLNLCYQAAWDLFEGKWSRTDILTFAEEISGVSRVEIYRSRLTGDTAPKIEVIDNVARYLLDLAEDIIEGKARDDVLPVRCEDRYDGMSGKIRTIATLSIPHQLLGHLVKLGLQPLFDVSLLPTQHASVPGRGQTGLLRQTIRYLRSKKLSIRYTAKTDVTHAYGTLKYSVITEIIGNKIPSAKWIISLLKYLDSLAPDGHLIIGGYLDAWLFNYAMSLALHFVLEQGYFRRDKFIPYVKRIETYMDDFIYLGSSYKGIKRAITLVNEYMHTKLHISCRMTTHVYRIPSVEEEKKRKREARTPAQRGGPCIDAAGFCIHRTYTVMRPRVAKRVIRLFTRAQREYKMTGTVRIKRARQIVARYGSVVNTKNYSFCKKYNVYKLVALAKRVTAHHARIQDKKDKEWLTYVVQKYSEQCVTKSGNHQI